MSTTATLETILAEVRQGDDLALNAWADQLEEQGNAPWARTVRFAGLMPDLGAGDRGGIYVTRIHPRLEARYDASLLDWFKEVLKRGGRPMLVLHTLLDYWDDFYPLWEYLARRLELPFVHVQANLYTDL